MSAFKAPAYEVIEGWEQLPPGYTHKDVCSVTIDSNDRLYLITRGDPRVIVYERDGTFVTSWGEEVFSHHTHSIRCSPDGFVYTVDDGDHTVRKFTPDGKQLMVLGTPNVPSDSGYDPKAPGDEKVLSIKRGAPPFNRPTGVAFAPNGEIYVSDGYGNASVHRFTPEGKLIQTWGEPGSGPGQFYTPHDVWVLSDGRVMVADRENERIQFFSPDGEYLDQWTDVQRPTSLYVDPREGLIYVGELCWRPGDWSFARGRMPEYTRGRMTVFDSDGNIVLRWANDNPSKPGQLAAAHGCCIDSRGDLYVAECTYSVAVRAGLEPADCHTFQKFARKG